MYGRLTSIQLFRNRLHWVVQNQEIVGVVILDIMKHLGGDMMSSDEDGPPEEGKRVYLRRIPIWRSSSVGAFLEMVDTLMTASADSVPIKGGRRRQSKPGVQAGKRKHGTTISSSRPVPSGRWGWCYDGPWLATLNKLERTRLAGLATPVAVVTLNLREIAATATAKVTISPASLS